MWQIAKVSFFSGGIGGTFNAAKARYVDGVKIDDTHHLGLEMNLKS